ncbi:hypothetical protein [Mesorhizobium sp.]|uniref:hypothetical protein n=1 Tax=Mesorhizobium sp. TaxID=1871066 RepID=UPI00257968C8|nr:hypothetical protein [Mesorhizobium sp.]
MEKKDHEKVLLVAPGIVTKDNIDKIDPTQIFAPDGWKPELRYNSRIFNGPRA